MVRTKSKYTHCLDEATTFLQCYTHHHIIIYLRPISNWNTEHNVEINNAWMNENKSKVYSKSQLYMIGSVFIRFIVVGLHDNDLIITLIIYTVNRSCEGSVQLFNETKMKRMQIQSTEKSLWICWDLGTNGV